MFNNLYPKLDKMMHGGKSLSIGNNFFLKKEHGGVALYSDKTKCAHFFPDKTATIHDTDKTVVAVECFLI